MQGGDYRRCAQRLSASLNSAPDERSVVSAHTECSTPFGITEFGTGWTRSTEIASGAQRLSASLNSALTESAPMVTGPWNVLNAFRHH